MFYLTILSKYCIILAEQQKGRVRMIRHRTYKYRLCLEEEQKAALTELFNEQDRLSNFLALWVNQLMQNNIAPDEIRRQLLGLRVKAGLEPETVKQIQDEIIDKVYRHEYIKLRKPYAGRRQMSLPPLPIWGDKVRLPGLGWVKVKFHRPLPAGISIYSVTISEENYRREYFVSFGFHYEEAEAGPYQVRPERVLGLDYKQDGLYMDSRGCSGNYPGFIAQGAERARALREMAARHRRGSCRWLKLSRRADRLERKMLNRRKDWQYKQAAALARENDAVCVESLDLRAMEESNRALSFKLRDNNWYGFKNKLGRKLAQQGKPLIEVSRYFPSSQLCSVCGYRFGKQPLYQRIVNCPACGSLMDRDYNAARNIRNEGIRLLEAA